MAPRRKVGKRRVYGQNPKPDQAATAENRVGIPESTMAETDVDDAPGEDKKPALQVIVLGSGGGPVEHNTTALLVRSTASGWTRSSVIAVDAGVHLGAIARILESTQPQNLGAEVPLPHTLQSGPFAGLELQSPSPIINAAHITQSLIDTYLITHPHLDHISGFVVNTAGLPGIRPKRLAGLPGTIAAFKTHIFNNVIWPNLSDENNGAGLVTYMRLVEGGSPALGEGEGEGYVEVSDGLAVKAWGVSHGHCIENHSHRGSQSGQGGRYGSIGDASGSPLMGRSQYPLHTQAPGPTSPLTPCLPGPLPTQADQTLLPGDGRESVCVYNSSAYFIRDVVSGKEVLIFGDVEPDSISLSPRNLLVWREAAPKIVSGTLQGIFIECSYDNSQPNSRLFGHLKPCLVIEELKVLAGEVGVAKMLAIRETKKRKRGESQSIGCGSSEGLVAVRKKVCEEPVSPKSAKLLPGSALGSSGQGPEDVVESLGIATHTTEISAGDDGGSGVVGSSFGSTAAVASRGFALKGLTVVLIHIKDRLVDGYQVKERILQELREEEKIEKLGCEFVVSSSGQSLFF